MKILKFASVMRVILKRGLQKHTHQRQYPQNRGGTRASYQTSVGIKNETRSSRLGGLSVWHKYAQSDPGLKELSAGWRRHRHV